MAKRYSKRTVRKTRIRLSPRDAEDIIKQEFTDENKNRHILRFRFKLHSPIQEGDMQLKYNQNNEQQGEQ